MLTPLAFAMSVRGLFVDATKWFGLAGGLISGSLLALLFGSLVLS
jgi:hypothetical protein